MTKDDTEPMDAPHPIPAALRFTPEQYQKLIHGLDPEAMEDKWFVYVEDDVIHVHRSWTGYEMFRAKLQPAKDGGYAVTEILAERNAEKYTNTDDAADAWLFARVVANLVLDISAYDIQERN